MNLLATLRAVLAQPAVKRMVGQAAVHFGMTLLQSLADQAEEVIGQRQKQLQDLDQQLQQRAQLRDNMTETNTLVGAAIAAGQFDDDVLTRYRSMRGEPTDVDCAEQDQVRYCVECGGQWPCQDHPSASGAPSPVSVHSCGDPTCSVCTAAGREDLAAVAEALPE